MAEQYYHIKEKFELESGVVMEELTLCYATLGKLNADKSNVVWVCHAFTGHPDVRSWWGGLFGDGKFFDPQEDFIVCANMPASCYGSTGPLTPRSDGAEPWYHDFPQWTNRDMVRSFDLLRKCLKITKVKVLIGASMGGQHVLEWAHMCPEVFDFIVPIATNALHSPWGIAFNEAQRMAIEADPSWKESQPRAGIEGMKAARAVAMLSYRSYEGYLARQKEESFEKIDDYRAASYQRYMGEKLALRFNAFTYWYLSKAMDSHHMGRGRGSLEEVLRSIRAEAILVGLKGDNLFPPEEQKLLARYIPNADYHEINSIFGHDGFLVENEALENILRKYLADTHRLSKD